MRYEAMKQPLRTVGHKNTLATIFCITGISVECRGLKKTCHAVPTPEAAPALGSCQSSSSYTVLIINYHFLLTVKDFSVRKSNIKIHHSLCKEIQLNLRKIILHLECWAGVYAKNDNYSFA